MFSNQNRFASEYIGIKSKNLVVILTPVIIVKTSIMST